jgi:deoxycytidylate deaminase
MPPAKPAHISDAVEGFDFFDSEIVIGFVFAVGTDYRPIQAFTEKLLTGYGYKVNIVRISSLISALTDKPLIDTPEIKRIHSHMDAGNAACEESGRKDIWALAGIAEINKARKPISHKPPAMHRTANLLFSLKRPEEVSTLRKVYGDGFFLIGVFSTEKERLEYLVEQNAPKHDALELIRRDSEEPRSYGQQTRDTFYLADVFVQFRNQSYEGELQRFFDLVFSNPYITPTAREHAMFLAYASSLRSGQLGRQVGAAITSRSGDVLSVGCNDVPRPGGGLYWPGEGDKRDHILGFDSNDRQREKQIEQLIEKIQAKAGDIQGNEIRAIAKSIFDITEYGRAVNAEMDALLTCARSGVSPKDGMLYTTTFPCHNCTRHIIASGIDRVIYIEPYAKSRAEELHEDAILVEEKAPDDGRQPRRKIPFTPFVGIGPRRYFDLFSLSLSRGHELSRKESGKVYSVSRPGAWPRVPMSPFSYIERETLAIKQLDLLPKQLTTFDGQEAEHGSDKEQGQ